ncbi:uncharacterized protein LOC103316206 [Nasonia vitripennis]|uniref:Uncharacterized protein n=1 Tax=Nasonia vitripennis TaxID=7425 RepID=A0A7M7H407_NASVI|nr:uncharacterized protein LOC103316206 [Nasonia vitripennis]
MQNTINEFIKDGTYRIAVMKDTSFVDIFKHGNSSLMKKLQSFMLTNEELPQYVATTVEMVCSGGKIVLFMDEYSVRSNISNPSCELEAFDRGQLINMGFTFVKHSPYVGFFNYYFQRLRSYGVLQVLRKRYERGINDFETSYEIMPLVGTLAIFFILIVGILLSILIMAFENIYFYVNLRRHEFAKSRTNYWKSLIRPEF